ncbi:MAG: prepilin-type N-terminal cleavage/methylation domain-containing protein [Patiriisocius sp.]|jgi:prepilin-type N-terminal cleavage/methylation domain-containing protein
MPRFANKQGFTLLELLIVIAIVGLLATISVVMLDEGRQKSRNVALLTQMEEYQKALELSFTNTGAYPHPNTGSTRSRILCIGDGLSTGDDCMGSVTRSYVPAQSGVIEAAFNNILNIMPRMRQTQGAFEYSSPAYSGCSSNAAVPIPTSNTSCTERDYSFWFLLEGVNETCGSGKTANASLSGEFTLCRLQSK